ncbi:MAG: hypothetical protein AAF360_05445 [Pseudomonadota bacterium]
MRGFSLRIVTSGVAVGLLAACAAEPRAPDLGSIYSPAAGIESQERRPVISIPGTLGSRLVERDTGLVIWGGTDGLSIDPEVPDNARLIALPIGKADESLSTLKDRVKPDGVLRVARASILGIPLEIDVYQGVISTLIAGGFDFRRTREEEKTEREVNLDSFEFPYDWRRDIVEASSDLAFFIDRKKRQVLNTRNDIFGDKAKEPKFDLVAHSMGGLVTRYFLMYGNTPLPEDGSLPEVTWAGAKNVSRVVFIAPPNSGSVRAFENLVNGKSFGPFQPVYDPALIGTHVSTYQLFPRDRHKRVTIKGTGEPVALFDIETWDKYSWGVLNPAEDENLKILMPDEPTAAGRRARAKAHLAKILKKAEQFQRAMDRPVTPPPGLELFLVVGGGFETAATAAYDPVEGLAEITQFEEGDGVVLRASSLMDERQDGDYSLGLRAPISYRSVLLLPEEHVDITKSAVFGDNLLFWLLESPRSGDRLAQPGRISVSSAPPDATAATAQLAGR